MLLIMRMRWLNTIASVLTGTKSMIKLRIITVAMLLMLGSKAHLEVPQELFLLQQKQVQCLAKNVYHEARGEPYKGQVAIALVTLNRVYSDLYPDTICSVVYQKGQFSWTKNESKIRDNESWNTAVNIAYKVLAEYDHLKKFGATHFHNKGVSPRWKLKQISTIGNHVFYK